jgi:dTDP-4-dehydrorhamnose reductase
VRILLIGAAGQVGHELAGALGAFAAVHALSRLDGDLVDTDALRRTIDQVQPQVIVNAAAYNDVDGAERDPAAALRTNGEAVGRLGELCTSRRIGLVHYSTDFVFDGTKPTAYVEDDPVSPISAYGRSKLAGEQALVDAPALVLRTAWVFGLRRKSFVSTILRAARKETSLAVVDDQIGSPTFCRDLAVGTALVLHDMQRDPHGAIREARGVYHLTNAGVANRHELACAALDLDPRAHEHKVKEVRAIKTDERPAPARRPARAVLDCRKIADRFGVRLPDWREALARALADSIWFV